MTTRQFLIDLIDSKLMWYEIRNNDYKRKFLWFDWHLNAWESFNLENAKDYIPNIYVSEKVCL